MARRILYFYRMIPGDGRAHAVQIARTTAAMARSGRPVVLHIRRGRERPSDSDRPAGSAPSPVDGLAGIENLRVVTFRWRHRARWALTRRLAAAAFSPRAARSGGNVLYVREVGPYSVHLARTARRLGIPVFYEAHSIKSLLIEEAHGADSARPWLEMERALYASARGVVFTSPHTERFARERFGWDRPGLVAPNAGPPPTGRASGANASTEILYAGQLYRWKGFDLLLDALELLPGRRLTVAGGGAGDGEDLSRARDTISRAGLSDRVSLLGQVSPGEVLRLMSSARVGVIPLPGDGSLEARWFTAPLKLFEFWSTGLPVVATDLPSLQALIRHGETGVLVAPRAGELARAIERVLTDPDLANRLSERGLTEAGERTWDARARKILDFIDANAP